MDEWVQFECRDNIGVRELSIIVSIDCLFLCISCLLQCFPFVYSNYSIASCLASSLTFSQFKPHLGRGDYFRITALPFIVGENKRIPIRTGPTNISPASIQSVHYNSSRIFTMRPSSALLCTNQVLGVSFHRFVSPLRLRKQLDRVPS